MDRTIATHRLGSLLADHAGVCSWQELRRWQTAGALKVNASPVALECELRPGDEIGLGDYRYSVIEGGAGRLQVQGRLPAATNRRIRVHCGYHKCLTEFSKLVYRRSCRPPFHFGPGFKHFYHRDDAFAQQAGDLQVSSLSGHAINLQSYADIRVVRFIRDPRDLLLSGYFYHKRGAEHWCHLEQASDVDWQMVRGKVPGALKQGQSLTTFLQSHSLEEGLLAELEFRAYHYQSMRDWPEDDPRVRLYRYEDILGREAEVFHEIASFLELGSLSGYVAPILARRHSAAGVGGKKGHIRNASSGQWQEHFTPRVRQQFTEQYGDLLERYGYAD